MSSEETDAGKQSSDGNNETPTASFSSSTRPAPPSMSETTTSTRANSALSNPSSRKPRKRAKVSFSVEAISKDGSGDGSKVTVKEEHGIFLGPLLGRMMVSSSDQSDDGAEGTDTSVTSAVSSSEPVISFAPGALTNEKMSQSGSPHGILKRADSSQPLGDSNVDYDNLVVQMGLLKCGHRYRAVVPIPDYWKEKKEGDKKSTRSPEKDDNEQEVVGNGQSSVSDYAMDVRIAEDSLDEDLRGEVQREDSDVSSGALPQRNVYITLSARRRGPYRGRFVLELTRRQVGASTESRSTSLSESSQDNQPTIDRTSKEPIPSTSKSAAPSIPQKCMMSLQVDATIMGKDMGTPKLRNGVVCSGKIVGYDSDEETEWQGFD